MNDSSNEMRADRFDDGEELSMLLAGDVLDNLSADERSRLEELLLSERSTETSTETLQRVAGSIALAAEVSRQDWPSNDAGNPMALKSELIDKIRGDASAYFPEKQSLGEVKIQTGPSAAAWLGWFVAASLAIVLGGMWMAENRGVDSGGVASSTSQDDVDGWYESNPDAIRLNWTVNDSALVRQRETDPDVNDARFGTVAWDANSQTGFMSFEGLPKNDPAVEQYQLWIIDPKRDEKPIDGGVFDITDSGQSWIPIHAKLSVIEPVGFAITVEKPGGVVVSDQSRLPLLAMVP